MTFLVDTSVLLDILTKDPSWFKWSHSALAECGEIGPLFINPLIYAETSQHFSTIEALEEALPRSMYNREALPWEAAFLAGRAFVEYRRRGGVRSSPMPDFYIGAHAVVRGMTLLTRDPRRVRAYYPGLKIISPE